MNKIKITLLSGLLVLFACSMAYAQGPHHHHPHGAPMHDGGAMPDSVNPDGHCMPMFPAGHTPGDFNTAIQPQRVAHYFDHHHGLDMFVVINDADNSVDVLFDMPDTIQRSARDTVDIVAGVHELTKIYRPQSLDVVDGKIVYLAANNDSSIIRVLFATPCGKIGRLAEVRFQGVCNAFTMGNGRMRVVGDNPLGYTVAVFDISDGVENISVEKAHITNYHKPKKAEVIADADKYGIGLTVAAVSVVFLVLMFLAIIFTQYGRLLTYMQKRRAAKAAQATGGNVEAALENIDHSGDIDAVIAAAIYLYNEELHDEENTVITIKSVERPWTPWNAKFYNMNQNNFNNIRHTRR